MITRLQPDQFATVVDDLTDLLHDCVHAGASIGFILPFPPGEARTYWCDHVAPSLQAGLLDLFVAHVDGRVLGTVQLIPAPMPNQPHRADVAKLLVHPNARRRGLGRALMQALQQHAAEIGRTLLVLDTRSSDPSRRLYQGLGFEVVGEIPNYCRNPSEHRLEPTTFMFKDLS